MAEIKSALSPEEKQTMEQFQQSVHQIIMDLGKVELQLSDLESVKKQIKDAMAQVIEQQNQFFAKLEEKYGKGVVDIKTMEYIASVEQE